MKVRKHIYFSGRVQGVGFRYSAVTLARTLDVTGWVRNLADGRVEMEAQGREEAIDLLLSRLHAQRWIVIEDMEIRTLAPLGDESAFTARDW